VDRLGGASLSLEGDGLYAVARLTDRGDALLAENPQLGVSARIVEGYERSDGQYFPAALQHVLATLDPRIPGLGSWQAVEASNGVQITVDLSSTHFEGDEPPAPPSLRQQALASLGLPADATDAEISALMEALLEADEEDQALARWGEGMILDEPVPDGPELSGTLAGIQRHIDLSNALDELRVLEDAEPLPRLAEDRLSHLLGRVGRGSYTPQPQPGYAPAHHLDPGHPGPVTTLPNCGPSDPVGGYCMNRQHRAGCGSLSTAEMAEAVKAPLRGAAYQPMVDQFGQPYQDQFGQAVTLRGAVEASMGERIGREHVFEGHPRRELVSIQRHVVVGDADDPDGDLPMPDATRRTAAALASHLGLASANPARGRALAREQRDRVIEAQRLARGGRRALGTGETMQERAARVSKPPVGELVKVEDGVSGSLPVFRRAG
jgi:hypothetical protein